MNDLQSRNEVRIHIDREEVFSSDPTTGMKLYKLGEIGEHKDLYREAEGDAEDVLVPHDDTVIHLTSDEHFYSQKAVMIVVNGEARETSETKLSFVEVMVLAFGSVQQGPNIVYTVAYRKGPSQSPKGTLTAGQSVKVRKGMIFDVTATDRS